jgi:Fe-S-cluster containining protein
MNNAFDCVRCGRCCLYAGPILHIEQVDVDRWCKEGRQDILSKLFQSHFICEDCEEEWPSHAGNKCPSCGNRSDVGSYYWLDSRAPLHPLAQLMASPRCPFLKKVRKKDEYFCKIHDTKPEICMDFPDLDPKVVTNNEEECIEWGCKGYLKWKEKVRGLPKEERVN